ncbi:hypothetical protein OUZ56_022411 [Daphnia magna]|uniref:Uncharacterized protein n=1 Tax=Daphnia magna TaxID=35525 RepID=A0ABR0AWB8_9CRUS|nr:hypothetical protein OUZ56_022411 [Daphnia magna]
MVYYERLPVQANNSHNSRVVLYFSERAASVLFFKFPSIWLCAFIMHRSMVTRNDANDATVKDSRKAGPSEDG